MFFKLYFNSEDKQSKSKNKAWNSENKLGRIVSLHLHKKTETSEAGLGLLQHPRWSAL